MTSTLKKHAPGIAGVAGMAVGGATGFGLAALSGAATCLLAPIALPVGSAILATHPDMEKEIPGVGPKGRAVVGAVTGTAAISLIPLNVLVAGAVITGGCALSGAAIAAYVAAKVVDEDDLAGSLERDANAVRESFEKTFDAMLAHAEKHKQDE